MFVFFDEFLGFSDVFLDGFAAVGFDEVGEVFFFRDFVVFVLFSDVFGGFHDVVSFLLVYIPEVGVFVFGDGDGHSAGGAEASEVVVFELLRGEAVHEEIFLSLFRVFGCLLLVKCGWEPDARHFLFRIMP